MGMINVSDKVSRYFSLGSGSSTKFTSALYTWRATESSQLDSAVAHGTEHWRVSEGATWQPYPMKWTQKNPRFEPTQKGKENLVVKLLAETEHGRQDTSVNLQGIPGFLSGLSPLEHLWGSWRDSTASINGPCLRVEYNNLSYCSSDGRVPAFCWEALVPGLFEESNIISLDVSHIENIHEI